MLETEWDCPVGALQRTRRPRTSLPPGPHWRYPERPAHRAVSETADARPLPSMVLDGGGRHSGGLGSLSRDGIHWRSMQVHHQGSFAVCGWAVGSKGSWRTVRRTDSGGPRRIARRGCPIPTCWLTRPAHRCPTRPSRFCWCGGPESWCRILGLGSGPGLPPNCVPNSRSPRATVIRVRGERERGHWQPYRFNMRQGLWFRDVCRQPHPQRNAQFSSGIQRRPCDCAG